MDRTAQVDQISDVMLRILRVQACLPTLQRMSGGRGTERALATYAPGMSPCPDTRRYASPPALRVGIAP